jgi:NADH oxidase (H2O2-forming)
MLQEKRAVKTLIVGGGPGGRVSYMMLRKMGVDSVALVADEEPTVICSLPYGVGRRLVPDGPEATVVNLETSHRLPPDMSKDVLWGRAVAADGASRTVTVRTAEGDVTVTYETLILAPGAVPWIPALEGIFEEKGNVSRPGPKVMVGDRLVEKSALAPHVHVLRGAQDARRLDELAGTKGTVAVIGSGAIGLEVVEALVDRGNRVILLEALPHVVAALDADMAAPVARRLEERGVSVFTDARVTGVSPRGLSLADGRDLAATAVVFAAGVRPDTSLAASLGLRIERGIVVNEGMETSLPGVYAVGDAVQISDGATGLPVLPLIGTLAMRQAMVAVGRIVGMPMALPPATVWGVSEIFGLHWGAVGWSREAAERAGLKVDVLSLPVRSRDPFMPSGKDGVWKVVVAAEDGGGLVKGQILGFQVVTEGDSPLSLAERFVDIITRRERVSHLFGHYFIHSPSHNAVDDPFLGFLQMGMPKGY